MNRSAARNLLVAGLVVSAGAFAAYAADRWVEKQSLLQLLKDAWIIQAVFVTAVVALIYRLQSDVATLAGLRAVQRAELDSMVKRKSARLWVLFFVIALSALLPRVATVVSSQTGQDSIISISIILMVASILYCAYLPGMWNELRQFITALVAERERKERQATELERLTEAAKE